MDKNLIQKMQNKFDNSIQQLSDENVEYWFARDLQALLGYARWENFIVAINRAIASCNTMKYNHHDHFRGVTKMVTLGSGSKRACLSEKRL